MHVIDRHGNRAWMISNFIDLKTRCCFLPSTTPYQEWLPIERPSDPRSGSCRQSLPRFLFALSSSASRGSSAQALPPARATRTRDRSALASHEKCPCVSKVTLLFVAALLLAAPPDVPPPAAWDSEVGGRTEVGFGHACAV